MDRLDRIALWLGLVGTALIVTGVIVGRPDVVVDLGIQGAYFNRDVGAPAFIDNQTYTTTPSAGLLDLSDGNVWLGAGIALLAASAVVLLARLLRARRAH